MGLQAGQTSEQNKPGIKTARGSISKTEQKIGFPHPPVTLRAPQTAKNKATGPGICDAEFSGVPAGPASLWASLDHACLPFSTTSAWISTAPGGQPGVQD